MWLDTIESAPGTVAQVRACSFELIRLAKSRGFALVLVGHVTKEGADRRAARARAHGRCGPVFRRRSGSPVPHPARSQEPLRRDRRDRRVRDDRSRALPRWPTRPRCSWRSGAAISPGSAVFAGLEGTRPVLVEVQALLAPNPGGTPRRSVIGWDGGRLRCCSRCWRRAAACGWTRRTSISTSPVGCVSREPAADLAVAAALTSAATDQPTSPSMVYFGEIGLSGEIRQVAQAEVASEGSGEAGVRSGNACPAGSRAATVLWLRPKASG